jgi:predicted nucleic acid-binding protein
VVVDASVVVKLFLPEELSDRADTLLRSGAGGGELGELHAPDLLYVEIANVLWKHVRSGVMQAETAAAHLAALLDLHITPAASRELAAHALALASEHDVSAYDASYVALAQALECELITADERLVNRLSRALPFVRWIGEEPRGEEAQGESR